MAENYTPDQLPSVLRQDAMNSEIMLDVDTETALIEPTSHRYDSSTGGRTTFLIPSKGVADMANSALVWELVSDEADGVVAYNFHAGGLGTIQRCTLRSGGQIVSQVDQVGLYGLIKKQFQDHDYKVGVLDARHKSSSQIEQKIAPAKIATGAATDAFHQLYNPECDQVDTFGKSYAGGAGNQHVVQVSKCLSNLAGRGPECVVRMNEIFPIFNSRTNLPVFAMAQLELEVEWAASGRSAANGGTAANQTNSCLIQGNPIPNTAGARARLTTATMAPNPILMMDFIHYPEEQMMQIQSQIEGSGIVIPFVEMVATRGVNPENTTVVAGGGQDNFAKVESNHILGMAGKEVEAIYVQKEYETATGAGLVEIDGNYNQVYTHRNILTNQYKSQQITGEEYNFVINNVRLYNQDVSNVALQHHQLSMCEPRGYQVPDALYSTAGYDVNKCKELLDSEFQAGAETAPQTVNLGRSKPYLSGTANVIGLNLKKYNILAPTVGNGQRIGSSPIELRYSRVAVGAASGAANSLRGAVNLNIYLEFKRTLLITPTGVTVSDA